MTAARSMSICGGWAETRPGRTEEEPVAGLPLEARLSFSFYRMTPPLCFLTVPAGEEVEGMPSSIG